MENPKPFLKPIKIPVDYNYIAVFLTLACNLRCSYCINNFSHRAAGGKHLSGDEWALALNRIVSHDDLPITLQGGEPTLHKDFNRIVNEIKPELNLDLLTNLQFDADEFMAEVKPERIKRDAPYASIRVSYHPEVMELEPLIEKTLKLQNAGYSIGIWGVTHPTQLDEIERARKICSDKGIDFRTKEFLGQYKGKLFGSYLYKGAFDKGDKGDEGSGREVLCKTSELIVGPDGGVYRCHGDLYDERPAIGNILDPDFRIEEIYRPCSFYGHCNPCDVKIKTNRFQQFGHTSVEIKVVPENKPAA